LFIRLSKRSDHKLRQPAKVLIKPNGSQPHAPAFLLTTPSVSVNQPAKPAPTIIIPIPIKSIHLDLAKNSKVFCNLWLFLIDSIILKISFLFLLRAVNGRNALFSYS